MLNLLRFTLAALALAAALSPVAYAASASKAFTVTNIGNGPLTITTPAQPISGNPAEYALTENTCSTVAAGDSCALTVTFTPSGTGARPAASLNFNSNGGNGPTHSIALTGAGNYPASCKVLLDAAPGIPSGTYTIDPDGAGAVAPFSAYCDMTKSGGGWTMIARQYEGSPVAWTGQTSGSSFSLAQARIPAHTQVGFGADNDPTLIDYVTFQYTTGDIPKTLVTGLKSGVAYHVHRSSNSHYDGHDPENIFRSAGYPEWSSTLTLDQTGGALYTWSFSPLYFDAQARGFALGGYLVYSFDSFAWTVWVR